ncbi:MAG: hypothetical protein R3D66_00915 [Alphaproteobacteria bacterium]
MNGKLMEILELGRNGVVTNTENLSRTKTYLGDIQLAVTSLLTAEAPLWLGDMAVGIQAANTHALAKTVELFQARVQAIRADTHSLLMRPRKKLSRCARITPMQLKQKSSKRK